MFLGSAEVLPDSAFSVVAGDAGLTYLERQPEHHNAFVARLEQYLNSVSDRFDLCIIDTNPNPDIRYSTALIVADYVVSPVELNQEAIDGIVSLFNHPRYGLKKIKSVLNPRLEMIGLLPNMVEPTPFQRANFNQLARAYSQLLIAFPGEPVRYAFIPTRTAIAEAQPAGVPLWKLRQTVPADQEGKVDPLAMPVRTAARDAWREIRPVFEELDS